MSEAASFLEWVDDRPRFRGLPVEQRKVRIGEHDFQLMALSDAAALLDDVELVEEFQRTDRLPYGLELWPAAVMLAEYIAASQPGQGRPALELGCGVGLVSIAAARHGWRMVATDADPYVLQFARHNAELNNTPIDSLQLLDWHAKLGGDVFSHVFAADVLYQLSDHQPFLRCLGGLLEPNGQAWVADPCRGVADRFAGLAESAGFDVRVIPTSATLHRPTPTPGRIFVLSRGIPA